jgi:hypothetical protein
MAVKAQAAFCGYLVIFNFLKLFVSSTLTTCAIWLCHVPKLSSTAPKGHGHSYKNDKASKIADFGKLIIT